MVSHDKIRELVNNAERNFLKIGPIYALTELLLALRGELPTPIEDLPIAEEKENNDFFLTEEEITGRQNDIIGEFKPLDPPVKTPLRPSHL